VPQNKKQKTKHEPKFINYEQHFRRQFRAKITAREAQQAKEVQLKEWPSGRVSEVSCHFHFHAFMLHFHASLSCFTFSCPWLFN
jgi:hypothetical protein